MPISNKEQCRQATHYLLARHHLYAAITQMSDLDARLDAAADPKRERSFALLNKLREAYLDLNSVRPPEPE